MKKILYFILVAVGLLTWLCTEIFILIASMSSDAPVQLILTQTAYFFGMIFTYIGTPLTFLIGRIIALFGTDPYTILYPGILPLTNTVSVLIVMILTTKIYHYFSTSKKL